ncbi:hypothetical protein DPMN_115612 [Dreissena polymorpha]|uniref:Tetratricopeptide repeat protein n=1 Tax=Dreissena polymorpha TaxID=45954 RepID=A0A9D4KMA3_DREPO|nr:hypothetical protein DPMN_115612 [Dreissena polymorpha]
MNCAEVDARPFLHYLQYITYGGLGERDNQLQALGVLESLFDDSNDIHLYHTETALNLLGHCFEMEGDYDQALHYYNESLYQLDINNAANLHVKRVLRFLRN